MTDLPSSPVTASVDFDLDGIQHGFLALPHSRDLSAWGKLMIPITLIKNGGGPTALITGGNHGDEYEGPIALFDFARTIAPDDVTGRIILVPALNYPAFLSATRTSPIDGGNLNRSFPGSPIGGITAKIADYVHRTLLPMADYVLDFHSGGKSLLFAPFCAAHILDDKNQQARAFEAVQAFGAPYSVEMVEIDAVGLLDTAAEAMGKVFITTELGGGGSSSAATVDIAKRGLSNVLRHWGLLAGDPVPTGTTWVSQDNPACFIFSQTQGLLEPFKDVGDRVSVGDVVASVYPIHKTGERRHDDCAQVDGVLLARHFPGLVGMGDCLAVMGQLKS